MRAFVRFGILAFIGAVALACTTPPSAAICFDPDNYPGCSGQQYVVVTDPGATACLGCTKTAYARCDGANFSLPVCDVPPPGWTLLTPDDGSGDSGSLNGSDSSTRRDSSTDSGASEERGSD
jgi:hypothetical protein